MLFAAAVSTGFVAVDVDRGWSLWALVLFINPFAAIAARNLFSDQFNSNRNLSLLAAAVLGLVGVHLLMMIYLNP